MTTFRQKLTASARSNDSFLCVGLDPDPDLMPIADVFEFNRAIIDATADLVCCYKPNMAFYEALGIPGLQALQRTLKHIPSHIPVIADAKRGDIGSTAKAYAKALFQEWGFDAATVNPYLGRDSVEPFLEYDSNGVFLLCHTSNPGAADFQELPTGHGAEQRPLYQQVALSAREWDHRGNLGLVVGATYPEQMQTVRDLCPDMVILAPGIGAQGGDLESTVRHGRDSQGQGIIINASRGVLYAIRDADTFAEGARAAAQELRSQMQTAAKAAAG